LYQLQSKNWLADPIKTVKTQINKKGNDKMEILTLKIENKKIAVKTPSYDEELVTAIKIINWKQRKYENKVWFVDLEDPNQQDDELSNLEYIRQICGESAERNKWLFADFSAKSEEEILADTLSAKHSFNENHVTDFLSVVEELPIGSLKLIRWGDKTLKLQLQYYLGDDKRDLFMRLKNASINSYKPTVLASFDHKMTNTFVFEVLADTRIIESLLSHKTGYLKNKIGLAKIKSFDDGIVHFDDNGEVWVGIPVTNIDLSTNDLDSRAWEICLSEETLYAGVNAKEFVEAWIEQRSVNVFGFFAPVTAQLPKYLSDFHLEEWFEGYFYPKLDSVELRVIHPSSLIRESWMYEHPADKLIAYYLKFGSSSGLDQDVMSDAIKSIEALKLHKASVDTQINIDLAKTNAINQVVKDLAKSTKSELVDFANRYKLTIKKSQSKGEIVALVTSQITQELAEQVLGLFEYQ
jgi:hypothetical protein